MHGAIGTNLGPVQRSSQGPGRKKVFSFPSPFLFPAGLKRKSMEEKVLIIGTNEASGPWRVDLVVQYYKIYLRKKQPRPPSSSPNVSWSKGPTSTSRCWIGERVIAGYWYQFMIKQHKMFFLPCDHVHKHLSHLSSAESDSWAQRVQWDQLWGLMQWSKSFRTYFHMGKENPETSRSPYRLKLSNLHIHLVQVSQLTIGLSSKVWSMENIYNPALLLVQALVFCKTCKNFLIERQKHLRWGRQLLKDFQEHETEFAELSAISFLFYWYLLPSEQTSFLGPQR